MARGLTIYPYGTRRYGAPAATLASLGIANVPFINVNRLPQLSFPSNGVIRSVGQPIVETFAGGSASFPAPSIALDFTYEWRRLVAFAGIGFGCELDNVGALPLGSPALMTTIFKLPVVAAIRFFNVMGNSGSLPANLDTQVNALNVFAGITFSTVRGDTTFRSFIWNGATATQTLGADGALLVPTANRVYAMSLQFVPTLASPISVTSGLMTVTVNDSAGNSASETIALPGTWFLATLQAIGFMSSTIGLWTTAAVAKQFDYAGIGHNFGRNALTASGGL